MKFYRYKENASTSVSYDIWGEIVPSYSLPKVYLNLLTYILVKETPKGFWIKSEEYWSEDKFWIFKTSKKKFAYPSKKEAVIGFLFKKKSHIKILENRLYIAQSAKRQIEMFIGNFK